MKKSFLLLFCAVAMLSWLSLYPWRQWHMALSAHFQVQYCVLSFSLLLLTIIVSPRWKWQVNVLVLGLGLLAICPSGFKILPYVMPQPTVKQLAPERLRLIHANVYARNQQMSALATRISQRQPDIIVLMEYTEALRHELENTQVLANYPYQYVGQSHLGLYSKWPLIAPQLHFIGSTKVANAAQLHTGIQWQQQRIKLVIAHPPVPVGKFFYEQQAHFSAWQQTFAHPTEPLLIVGDLNTSPWSAHFQDLLHHTVLRDSQRGFGLQGTWPQFYSPLGNDTLLSRLGGLLGLAQIPIDHVLISPEWQVGHWKRLDPVGSDHWPIEVDLRLKH